LVEDSTIENQLFCHTIPPDYYCPGIARFVWLQLRLDTIDGRNELWMWWERKWISIAHQRSASRSHSESFKIDCGDGIKSSNQNKFWKAENVARDSHFDWGSLQSSGVCGPVGN
jgi:hypothetical protein